MKPDNMTMEEWAAALEKRIEKLELRMVYHYHTGMGSVVDERGAAVWFDSLGEWRN